MPKKYLKIKQKMLREGKSEKAAETSAAKIYNATRKSGQEPVTGGHSRKYRTRTKN